MPDAAKGVNQCYNRPGAMAEMDEGEEANLILIRLWLQKHRRERGV
jgi:hypothetical protein